MRKVGLLKEARIRLGERRSPRNERSARPASSLGSLEADARIQQRGQHVGHERHDEVCEADDQDASREQRVVLERRGFRIVSPIPR